VFKSFLFVVTVEVGACTVQEMVCSCASTSNDLIYTTNCLSIVNCPVINDEYLQTITVEFFTHKNNSFDLTEYYIFFPERKRLGSQFEPIRCLHYR
jgi:hypothetical protein